jgi:hypothetical protein
MIAEVVPESDAKLGAGIEEAEDGIPAAVPSRQRAARSETAAPVTGRCRRKLERFAIRPDARDRSIQPDPDGAACGPPDRRA